MSTIIPDIKESDVVWQFAPKVALDAWWENEEFGVVGLKELGPNQWTTRVGESKKAQVCVKCTADWTIESSQCSLDTEQPNPKCVHVAQLMFELTRQQLVNLTESPSRARAKVRATAKRERLPFPPIAIPEVDGLSRHIFSSGGIGKLLEEQDWLDIVRIMELLTSMNNMRMALRRSEQLEVDGLADFVGASMANLAYLPHGWFTILEAGYEALGDLEGLKNLYEFYMAASKVSEFYGDESDYLTRLHVLSGKSFSKECRFVANAFYSETPLGFSRSYSMERLMSAADLSDDALFYCSALDQEDRDNVSKNLVSTIAINHPKEARTLLLEPLFHANTWPYCKSTSDESHTHLLASNNVLFQLQRVKAIVSEKVASKVTQVLSLCSSLHHVIRKFWSPKKK